MKIIDIDRLSFWSLAVLALAFAWWLWPHSTAPHVAPAALCNQFKNTAGAKEGYPILMKPCKTLKLEYDI